MMRIFSKKAESDNITIIICMILFFVGCFYVANWFMDGALSEVTSTIYHKSVDMMKNPVNSLTSNSEELHPACKEEFKCNQPGNESACASQHQEYNELCGIK